MASKIDFSELWRTTLWGVELWQLAAALAAVVVGWLVARALTPLIVRLMLRGSQRTETTWDDRMAEMLGLPFRLGIWAAVVFMSIPLIGFDGPAAALVSVVWRLAAVLILGTVLSAWVSVGGDLLREVVVTQDDEVIQSFVPIFVRSARLVVWAIVVVVALEVVGIEVMGLVAGLGIGGLAVAFAAKDTIGNLFGSLAIAADRPFAVGDFIKLGGVSGTVEEVGLRSTRLRTGQRSVITVPNGELMNQRIENVSRRDRILFNPAFRLDPTVSPAQIELIIDDVKKHLLGHERVYHDGVRVRLTGIVDGAPEVKITTWFVTTDYNESTALVEEMTFAILGIVAGAGTALAVPSRRMIERGGTGGDEAVLAAQKTVETRRTSGELWIPEPPARRV